MLKIFFSYEIDRLADAMATFLKIPPAEFGASPDDPSMVIAHSAGEASLKYYIARKKGICANIMFERSVTSFFESCVEKVPVAKRPGTLLDESMVFSFLYRKYRAECSEVRDMTEFQKKLLPVSRAEIVSRQLLKYVACKPENFDLEKNRYPSNVYGDCVKAIVSTCKNRSKVILADEWLNNTKYFGLLNFPKVLYIFDPPPLKPLEVEFLLRFLEDGSRHVFIMGFSPTQGYGIEIGRGSIVGEAEESKLNDALDSLSGGRVADKIKHTLWSKLLMRYDENADPSELYEKKVETNEGEASSVKTNLSIIQNLIIKPGDLAQKKTDISGLSGSCDSIVLRVYTQVRDEVRGVGDKIVELVSRVGSDNLGRATLFDDICVLIPSSVRDDYAAALSREFSERGIPFNMRQVVEHPVNQCFSAFKAFATFLVEPTRRTEVLDFAFHEAIASDEEMKERGAFIQILHSLGVYGGEEAETENESRDFGWAQGFKRIVDLAVGSADERKAEREPVIIDDEDMHLFLRHSYRLTAMFRDRRTTRELRISYSDWETYLLGLFDAWLRSDASYREDGMKILCSEMSRFFPAGEEEECVGFDEIVPFLNVIADSLHSLEKNSIVGGVQVQILNEFVMTRRCVFLLGQSRDAFPSSQVHVREFEQYSAAEMDEYAWNKWLLNTQDVFWVSATLRPKEFENIDISISPFARDLKEVFHASGIKLLKTCVPEADDEGGIFDEEGGDRDSTEERSEVIRARLWHRIKGELEKITDSGQRRGKYTNVMDLCETDRRQVWSVFDRAFCNETDGQDDGEQLAGSVRESGMAPSLSWKALAELFQSPNKTYRKYEFGINEYEDYVDSTSYKFLSSQGYAPVEAYAYANEARKCVYDVLLHCFLTRQLLKFEERLETAADLLRQGGAFPEGKYWEILRYRAMETRHVFRNKLEMSGIDENEVYSYRVIMKTRRPSMSKYRLWFENTFRPDETIVVDYENDILNRALEFQLRLPNVVFKGELNPIFKIHAEGKERIYVVDDRGKIDDERKQHHSYVTTLFARLFGTFGFAVPIPKMMFDMKYAMETAFKWSSDEKYSISHDIEMTKIYDGKVDEMISWLYDFYKSGYHELSEFTYKSGSEPKANSSEFARYVDGAEKKSSVYWRDKLAKDEPGALPEFAATKAERKKFNVDRRAARGTGEEAKANCPKGKRRS